MANLGRLTVTRPATLSSDSFHFHLSLEGNASDLIDADDWTLDGSIDKALTRRVYI
jgi:hypothetical protein